MMHSRFHVHRMCSSVTVVGSSGYGGWIEVKRTVFRLFYMAFFSLSPPTGLVLLLVPFFFNSFYYPLSESIKGAVGVPGGRPGAACIPPTYPRPISYDTSSRIQHNMHPSNIIIQCVVK